MSHTKPVNTLSQGWRTCGARAQMARGNHCCPSSLHFFRHTSVSILCRTCIYIYTHTHTRLAAYRLYMNYRCYQMTLRWHICIYTHTHVWLRTDGIWITVATKWHCNDTFVHKSERCEVLTGYLSLGRRPGDGRANTWHWAERFTVFFWNRKW